MGSEQNDKASFPPVKPKIRLLFFGSASNMNICSKCQGRDGKTLSLKSMKPMSEAESIVGDIKSAAPAAEQVIVLEKSSAAAMGSSLFDAAATKVVKAANRCLTYNRREAGKNTIIGCNPVLKDEME
ncbi:unnamed protein product [Linum trigynum]|uniref:Uncharacterized protein n=1 Tax=Linum trigynum TaxID=586398 RepID=A0AAV2GBU7_9ROSI